MKKGIFCIAIAIIVYMLTFNTGLPDYDLWARLAVGSIFFQTGNVLQHDIFSYLPTKDLWIDHEWGSGVVFYFLVRYFGDWGLFALKAFMLSAIFILIIHTVKLRNPHTAPGIFYFILIAIALLPGVTNLLRCQMFTYLFFSLWLYLLEKIRQTDDKRRDPDCPAGGSPQISFLKFVPHPPFLWLFPLTMLLWANVHGGFIAGMGLVGLYAFGELLNRRHPVKYFVILGMIVPVTLINPYGFELWHYIIDAALMPRPDITEWHSISLNGPFHVFAGIKMHIHALFIVFTALTLIVLAQSLMQRKKTDWTSLLLFTVLLYIGVKHQRHTAFFILAVPALFYRDYLGLPGFVAGLFRNYPRPESSKAWQNAGVGAGFVVLLIIFALYMPQLTNKIIVNPSAYPVGSLEFIKQNNIRGNLATSYTWGSYALWKLYPQCKILIDGRYEEVYADDIYEKAMRFSENRGDWQSVIRQYRTDIIVLPKDKYSPADVLNLPGWEIVYQDACSVLLLPGDKIKPYYIYPDYQSPLYLKEDLSKKIAIAY